MTCILCRVGIHDWQLEKVIKFCRRCHVHHFRRGGY